MSAFSTYLANEILDHVLRNAAFTAPTSLWVGLFTADTDLNDNNIAGASEVSGGSYTRQEAGGASGIDFVAAAGGATDNDAVIQFPTATADWGLVTHFALMDAATAGNVLVWGSLTVSKNVYSGDTIKFNVGDLDITLT